MRMSLWLKRAKVPEDIEGYIMEDVTRRSYGKSRYLKHKEILEDPSSEVIWLWKSEES